MTTDSDKPDALRVECPLCGAAPYDLCRPDLEASFLEGVHGARIASASLASDPTLDDPDDPGMGAAREPGPDGPVDYPLLDSDTEPWPRGDPPEYDEGVAVCMACGWVEHTAEQMAECLSVLMPDAEPEDEPVADLPGAGNCFEVAARLITGEFRDHPNAWLVHGLPRATGGAAEGMRIWHAWVEYDLPVESSMEGRPMFHVPVVVDRSNGNDETIPMQLYYRLGGIERTWRYSREAAMVEMLTHEHYGPWVEA